MSTHLRIGVDVDGILADFNVAYREVIHSLTTTRIPEITSTFPTVWNYERAAGLPRADETKVWDHIKKSRTFWQDLPPYPETKETLVALSAMALYHDVYFVTSRPGATAKQQTENFLYRWGWDRDTTMTVLISSEKGMVCHALELDYYIDDKNENVEDVYKKSQTQVAIQTRPWNWDFVTPHDTDVLRVEDPLIWIAHLRRALRVAG